MHDACEHPNAQIGHELLPAPSGQVVLSVRGEIRGDVEQKNGDDDPSQGRKMRLGRILQEVSEDFERLGQRERAEARDHPERHCNRELRNIRPSLAQQPAQRLAPARVQLAI